MKRHVCGLCGIVGGNVEIAIGPEVFWRCEPCAKKASAQLVKMGANVVHVTDDDSGTVQ